jgi:hypothetical protein
LIHVIGESRIMKEKKMKKLMMIMAVALVAGMSQAATIVWNSGTLYSLADASGTFSTTTAKNDSLVCSALLYIYTDAACTDPVAITGNTDTTLSPGSALNGTTSDSFLANTTYYAVLIVTANSTYGTATMTSSAVAVTIPGTASGGVNFLSAAAMPSSWTVVPEPTSMALLAFGAAALGLRRKFRK